jgi:formylglycine-generating enzyme required for sulfatase activity
MKTTHKPLTPPAANIALSPREVALKKLYRILAIVGVLAVILTAGALWPLYGDRLLRTKTMRDLWGKPPEMREPKINASNPPGPAPDGMVWIPGGDFYMGHDDYDDAIPVHMVYVDGFWMDKHEVTNEQYADFVKATGYVTDAEKQPRAEDFPDAPPDKLKPFSIIFKKPGPNDLVDLRTHQGWWDLQYGASWKHPEGPGTTTLGRENHPVVHVSYNDAVAYCRWGKKRLPTEAEWEFAARGGLDRKPYTWGDELKPEGKWMANIWQGEFPYKNTKEDGFEGTAPVGSFPPNGYGLHDMAGNAWEWCADWYRSDYYRESPDKNPQGPDSGFDWNERGVPKRVQRGGSFLCADNYCIRYVVGTRGKGEVTSAASHTGFRCAMNAK